MIETINIWLTGLKSLFTLCPYTEKFGSKAMGMNCKYTQWMNLTDYWGKKKPKRPHIVVGWFHLHKVQNQATVFYAVSNQYGDYLWGGSIWNRAWRGLLGLRPCTVSCSRCCLWIFFHLCTYDLWAFHNTLSTKLGVYYAFTNIDFKSLKRPSLKFEKLGKTPCTRLFPCPSTDQWIKKLWYIYTTEYYSAMKGTHLSQF